MSIRTIFLAFFLIFSVSGCVSTPASFVQNQAGWSMLELADGLTKEMAWGKVADAIKERDLEFEKIDKDAGYMRTAWNYNVSKTKTYATRVIIDFPSNGKTVRIKTEAQYLESGEWVAGFDSSYQATFKEEMASIVGKK